MSSVIADLVATKVKRMPAAMIETVTVDHRVVPGLLAGGPGDLGELGA